MPRKKKKPEYNPELSMEKLLKTLTEAYGSYDDRIENRHKPSLNELAAEYGLHVLKARKLLITGGVYSTAISRRVGTLAAEGFSTEEIASMVGLSKASVNSYLPYEGAAYKLDETSAMADRSKIYRQRSAAVNALRVCAKRYWEAGLSGVEQEKELLWTCVEHFEGYKFKTQRELPFTYLIKLTRGGTKGGELIFSRKAKGVTRATVELAYDRVAEAREKQSRRIPVMETPKKLNVFGASYIYAMFLRFGIICEE